MYENREQYPCSGLCEYGAAGQQPRDLGPDGKPLPGDDPTLICENCGWSLGDAYELDHQDRLGLHDPSDAMDGDHQSALASAGFGTDEDYGEFGGEA